MIDALVVGGGPSGMALAILLTQAGHGVRVLEHRQSIGEHSRAIGIHPPGVAVLERLGIGQAAVNDGVKIGRGVGLSRGRIVAELSFAAIPAQHRFVLSLPQNHTVALLRSRLYALDPTALLTGTTYLSSTARPGSVSVRFRDVRGNENSLEARFLIGADGTRSAVRRGTGIGVSSRELPDEYRMGDYPESTDFGSVAALFLHGEGIIESFPLPGNKRRWVSWTAQPEARTLVELIEHRTGHRVDGSRNSMLSSFGARNVAVSSMAHGNLLLIGDAAHEVSPIGGQGMTLGLLDAKELAPILDAALSGRSTGQGLAEQLRCYSTRRLAAARRAARQAHVNMMLGRPLWGPAGHARDALARTVFASDKFSLAVAATFTMTGGPHARR